MVGQSGHGIGAGELVDPSLVLIKLPCVTIGEIDPVVSDWVRHIKKCIYVNAQLYPGTLLAVLGRMLTPTNVHPFLVKMQSIGERWARSHGDWRGLVAA